MFDTLRRSVGLSLSRMRYRHVRDTVISFTTAITEAERVLVILPLGQSSIGPAGVVLEVLRRHYGDENITAVADEMTSDVSRLLPRSTVIRLLVPEVTVFYLPHRDVLARIARRQYDIAIDLNLDFLLPSAYICRESKARVRIGFAGKRADVFYNLQVKADLTAGRPRVYDRLVRTLQMF
jgi:ADP-heptose:LPS heptosyltransferase